MKQITEDYVSFEIAVLLKEKGFDERCGTAYTTTEGYPIRVMGSTYSLERNQNYDDKHYSMPSQSLALKWLRENNLYIEIRRNLNTFYFRWKVEQGAADKAVSEYKYDTYEEAVEAALKYTLENLI